MKTGILSILTVLLLIGTAAVAQPGYRGKKLTVQANLLFLPALANATYGRERGFTTFNTTGEASADYALNKRNSLGLAFRRLRTSNINGYSNRYEEVEGISDSKVFANSLELQYRVYKRKSGNIAPLGKYFQWGAGMLFCQVRQPGLNGPTSFQMYAFRMGRGRNRILFDRMILYHGWELSQVVPASGGEGLSGATYYYDKDPLTMAQYRLWRHSMVNFRIGLGFLAH
jgi:hypothetical protein